MSLSCMCQSKKRNPCTSDTKVFDTFFLWTALSIETFCSNVANKAIQMLICTSLDWLRIRTDCIWMAVQNGWITSLLQLGRQEIVLMQPSRFPIIFVHFIPQEKEEKIQPTLSSLEKSLNCGFYIKLHLVTERWVKGRGRAGGEWQRFGKMGSHDHLFACKIRKR